MKEDEARKKKLEDSWRRESEQKLENEKRGKLREWEEERRENVTRRVQLEAIWRSELEKKIENEKRDKLREWEEERRKEDVVRKTGRELEENGRRRWMVKRNREENRSRNK